MLLSERELNIEVEARHRGMLDAVAARVSDSLRDGAIPVRFVVTDFEPKESGRIKCHCEIGILSGLDRARYGEPAPIFDFSPRLVENMERFTAVFLVPTGIGAVIGGHAGDAAPAARVMAAACDRLITHPNVVNAADINEMPENALYVEGSVITRLMMGAVGLAPVRANRILTLIDDHENPIMTHSAINAVNAARASAGFRCERVETLRPRITMSTRYASSGRATGRVEGFDSLCRVLDRYKDEFDAVAISTVVDVDRELHDDYFYDRGDIVNPWGGIEAMLTHALSSIYNVPSAHSPMYEGEDIMNEDAGVMDPRKAAEGVSIAFLHSVLHGLTRSPRIVTDPEALQRPGVVTSADVNCLVIPDGCLGLPTLAALEQGIPVIAVKENRNRMQNTLEDLPWKEGQFHRVENYLEATGLMTALKAGVMPAAVRRPIEAAKVGEQPEHEETRADLREVTQR